MIQNSKKRFGKMRVLAFCGACVDELGERNVEPWKRRHKKKENVISLIRHTNRKKLEDTHVDNDSAPYSAYRV